MIALSMLAGTEEKNPGSRHQSGNHSFLALGEGEREVWIYEGLSSSKVDISVIFDF